MKITKYIGVFLLVLFLSSCSKEPKILTAIPKDATTVSVINLKSIIKKGKLQEMDNSKFLNFVKKELKNEGKIFSDFVENPKTSGVDLNSDMFLFTIDESRSEKFLCYLVKINDESKFSIFLNEISKKTGLDINIEKSKNFNFLDGDNKFSISWDEEKAVFVYPVSNRSTKNLVLKAKELMELKGDNQITKNEEFNKFYENKKDISFWTSTNILKDDYSFMKMQKMLNVNFLGNYLSYYLSFEEGYISLKYDFKPNKEIEKIIDESEILENSFDDEILKYFPKTNYFVTGISINPMGIYNILKERDEFEKMNSEFEKEMNFGIKEFLKSFKGNIIFDMFGAENIEYSYTSWGGEEITKTEFLPLVGFAFDINGDEKIKRIIEKIDSRNKAVKHNGYYEFKLFRYPIYYAFNDEVFLMTNYKKSIEKFKDGGYNSNNLVNSNIGSEISKTNFYTFLNLNLKDYPEEVQKMINESIRESKERKVFEVWNELAKSVEVKQIGKYSSETIFKLKEEDENSLHTIITKMDDNYTYFFN